LRTTMALAALMLLAPLLIADDRHVVFDEKIDFSSLKTFAIREGRSTTKTPELNNKLILKNIENAVRSDLVSKGMVETQSRPDIWINFTLGQDRRAGPSTVFDQGVLVIDFMAGDTNDPVWHGVYSDPNSSPAKLATKLPGNVKKLLSPYPPKKKK
jgi:hypothetical protein